MSTGAEMIWEESDGLDMIFEFGILMLTWHRATAKRERERERDVFGVFGPILLLKLSNQVVIDD